MTQRQEGDVFGLCPVCGLEIDLLNPEQIPTREGRGVEEAIEAIVEANEALILSHAQTFHSMRDVMVALGTARTALQDIREAHEHLRLTHDIVIEATSRGLGGK